MLKPIKGVVSVFGVLPLLSVVMAAYFVAVLFGGTDILRAPGFAWPVQFTVGEMLLTAAALCLPIEWIKSTDTSDLGVVELVLSGGLALISLVAFATLPAFHTSTFAILVLLQISDALGGAGAAVKAGRRDWGAGA